MSNFLRLDADFVNLLQVLLLMIVDPLSDNFVELSWFILEHLIVCFLLCVGVCHLGQLALTLSRVNHLLEHALSLTLIERDDVLNLQLFVLMGQLANHFSDLLRSRF